MSEKETVKVAFVRDREDGEIVAVFPEIPHNSVSRDVIMYVHNGQHVPGMLEWAREQEKPNADEIVELYNELRGIGYDMILTTL